LAASTKKSTKAASKATTPAGRSPGKTKPSLSLVTGGLGWRIGQAANLMVNKVQFNMK
jgi:hypothetical protein